MKPKINYHYTISYKPVCCFRYLRYGVDETAYRERIFPYINKVVEDLQTRPDSRQEVIVTHTNFNNYACLISLQFQIVKNKLIMIANFRSQCEVNGRPADTEMLRSISYRVMKMLKLKRYKIYVNVGNYHINKELTEANATNEEVKKNLELLKLS